jgi:hypothetical protein
MVREAGRLDLDVESELSLTGLADGRSKARVRLRFVAEATLEEGPDAGDVAVEVAVHASQDSPRRVYGGYALLGILMLGRDHLGKIDEDWLAFGLGEEDIEFVEVAVDEAGTGETDDEVHELGVERARVGDFGDLTEWEGVDELHDEAMSGLINGLRYREVVLVQDLRPLSWRRGQRTPNPPS